MPRAEERPTTGTLVRASLAVVPPMSVAIVQHALWRFLEPYAWFMFVPALFVSSWIGGRRIGIATAAATTVVIWWLFVPPEGAAGKNPLHLIPAVVFFGTCILFAQFHERLRRATREARDALDAARASNEEVSRLYRKAQEVDALKTRFFAAVSHELRTPLTLVLGPTERLARAPDLPESARRELDGVARNARVVLRHVNDLLDLVKIEAGRMRPEHADVDVAQMVRLVAEPFATLAREKGIALAVDAPDSLRAEVDPGQVRAIVTNLLSNALKFTPAAGRVRVGVAEDRAGGRFVLEFADSGPGIPPDQREAVFERFHQLEGAARGGTGLGLAIARDFVSLHGGTIALHDAPEGGTLARVELPRRAPEGAVVRRARELSPDEMEPARQLAAELQPRAQALPAPTDGADGPLVLVVEDNPDMSRFICESVPPGHRVIAAFDGRQGLAKAVEQEPDLLLVDVMMPEMGGDELVRAIRQVPALARTPILVLTARADEELRIRLLREGAQDYLVKPFAVEELRARILNLIAAKRALEAEARLASLVELAPDGIFIASADGRITDVNAAGCRLLDRGREEIVGRSITDFIAPEDADRLGREIREVAAGRGAVSEWTARRPDGSYVPVEVSARALPDGRFQAFARDVSERRRLADDLQRSAADLRRAQAVAHIGSWTLDVEGRHLLWSEENYRIFGVPCGTPMKYESFLAIVHPEDRALVDRHWRAALGGAPYDLEHRIVVGDEIKWVRERAELVFDAEGRVSGGVGTAQDVSDRKRIELALRAAEQRALDAAARTRALSNASVALSEAVAAMPEASVATVMSAIAVQAQLLVGAEYVAFGIGTDPNVPFDPWIQIGMPVEIAERLARAPRPVGALGVVARRGQDVRVPDVRQLPEFRGFPPGHPVMRSFLGVPVRIRGASAGNLYLANKRGAPEFTADDQRIVEILAARAGTALETARLYESVALGRAWMQAVVDQMPEGVLLVDARGRVTAENQGLRALAGACRGEHDPFGNACVIDLRNASGARLAPEDLPYVGAVRHGESFSGRELEVHTADGRIVPVLVGVAPVTGADGACTGAVMIVQDMSAVKELERLREEWTSVVAHDLRQPVNVISFSAALLDETRRAQVSPERRGRALVSIRKATQTLDRMIGDLMDASRIEARRLALQRRDTSLATLVRDVVERQPDIASRCDVEVAAGGDRRVLADPGRIEQVLANLLTNAVKYGDRDARIRVDVVPRSREVEVIVTNRGPGIPPQEIPRLFQRFGRTRDARAGSTPGIGLGLYLCKGLIEAHDGRIWVESTPGDATAFHFTVPYAPRREAEVARA